MANPEWDNYRPGGAIEDRLQQSEERCARAEERIVELEGTIYELRAKLEIMTYPQTAFKEYRAK